MQKSEEEKRSTRVSLLKRLIVIVLIVGILIPIVLCILLFVKVNQLQQQVNELAVQKEQQKQTSVNYAVDENVLLKLKQDVYGSGQPAEIPDSQKSKEMRLSPENSPLALQEDEEHVTRVYLTFDDGPSSNTGAILDILKQYGIKGTFFVTGKTQEYYVPLYQRIVEEGHTLGMHSYSHRYNEIYASKEAFTNDLQLLQEYLYDVTGVWSRFYRFPGGSSNQVSGVPMKELADYLDGENIYYLDWNVSCGDATGKNLRPQQIADNVTENVQKYRTAVVLLHDASDKTSTVEALPIIIETLLETGNIEFVPVSDDMNIVQHLQMDTD